MPLGAPRLPPFHPPLANDEAISLVPIRVVYPECLFGDDYLPAAGINLPEEEPLFDNHGIIIVLIVALILQRSNMMMRCWRDIYLNLRTLFTPLNLRLPL